MADVVHHLRAVRDLLHHFVVPSEVNPRGSGPSCWLIVHICCIDYALPPIPRRRCQQVTRWCHLGAAFNTARKGRGNAENATDIAPGSFRSFLHEGVLVEVSTWPQGTNQMTVGQQMTAPSHSRQQPLSMHCPAAHSHFSRRFLGITSGGAASRTMHRHWRNERPALEQQANEKC